MDHALLQFLQEFRTRLVRLHDWPPDGPRFLHVLETSGLSLNLLAFAVVGLGVALTLGIATTLGLNLAAAAGLFAGATTNTPPPVPPRTAFGQPGPRRTSLNLPGFGYSIAYPGGIAGIIGSMLILKAFFRIDPDREAATFREQSGTVPHPPQRLNVEVTNPQFGWSPRKGNWSGILR